MDIIINFFNQYKTEIIQAIAIILPILPAIIVKVINDGRFKKMLLNVERGAQLKADNSVALSLKIESINKAIDKLADGQSINEKIQNLIVATEDRIEKYAIETKTEFDNAKDHMIKVTNDMQLLIPGIAKEIVKQIGVDKALNDIKVEMASIKEDLDKLKKRG